MRRSLSLFNQEPLGGILSGLETRSAGNRLTAPSRDIAAPRQERVWTQL